MRTRHLLFAMSVPLVLWALLPMVSSGQSGAASSIQSRIEQKRRDIESKKRKERAVSQDIASLSNRIRGIQGDITKLQAQQVALEADLDRQRAELARIQERLRQERVRLLRLRARFAEGRRALATRLVELYKADTPDYVTIVLDSDGFADLLSRTEFMRRVARQDQRIIERVKRAKAESAATARRLDELEGRRQRVAASILARRNQVAAVKGRLVTRRGEYSRARGRRVAVISSIRADRRDSERDLAALERASARITARLRTASSDPSPRAGPVRAGTGRLVWPVNGPLTSPFGPRWGRLHAGIDIGAPDGTPIRAADSGRVVVAGWEGGYGQYTCIDHGQSFATCYAHQSRIAVSVGQSVAQGVVIGAVGNTGNSFGAHLHFETRVGGSPQNPLNYL